MFFSDRNRILSAWTVDMDNGRPQGAPRLVKNDVGRVWVRGFTRDGTLHVAVNTGYAELYLSTLDGRSSDLQLLSPRQSLSNLYPRWSPDGRWLVYVSERGFRVPELWVYDSQSRTESRVPTTEKLGTAVGWSADSASLLVRGNDDRLYVVDRSTGQSRLVARDVYGAQVAAGGDRHPTEQRQPRGAAGSGDCASRCEPSCSPIQSDRSSRWRSAAVPPWGRSRAAR